MVLLLAGLGMGKDTVGKLDEYCVVLQPPALAGCDRPKMASLDRAVFDNCRAHVHFLYLCSSFSSLALYTLYVGLFWCSLYALYAVPLESDGNDTWLLDLARYILIISFSINMRCP